MVNAPVARALFFADSLTTSCKQAEIAHDASGVVAETDEHPVMTSTSREHEQTVSDPTLESDAPQCMECGQFLFDGNYFLCNCC